MANKFLHYTSVVNRQLLWWELMGKWPGDHFVVDAKSPTGCVIMCPDYVPTDDVSEIVNVHNASAVATISFSVDGHSFGVGTVTPSAKLDVYGSFKQSAADFSILNGGFSIQIGQSTSLVGFYGKTPVAQAAATVNLTDSTSGTANNICVDVASIGIADPAKINDNFADCIAKVNAVLNALRNLGVIAT